MSNRTNWRYRIDGRTLVIEVDLDGVLKLTKSERSVIIAQCRGMFVHVPGDVRHRIVLAVTRTIRSDELVKWKLAQMIANGEIVGEGDNTPAQ